MRAAPEPGSGIKRWLDLADLLGDCRAILTTGIGAAPRRVLTERGLEVIEMEGLVLEAAVPVDGDELGVQSKHGSEPHLTLPVIELRNVAKELLLELGAEEEIEHGHPVRGAAVQGSDEPLSWFHFSCSSQ